MPTVAAIDLGATSGRVLVGRYEDGRLDITETSRFAHGPVAVPTAGGSDLVWDLPALWSGIVRGLAAAGPLDSVGVDTWAVDYGRLDGAGRLLALPQSYRSPRTADLPADPRLPTGDDLFRLNGLAQHPFTTCYQLLADLDEHRSGPVDGMALLPDLIGWWLSGTRVCEVTNASTTGLLDPRTRDWQPDVCAALAAQGIDVTSLFGPLVEPGHVLGPARGDVVDWEGAPPQVVAVGSHDTASAVAAIPAATSPIAYVSSGTWSLVGLELTEPVCTPEARAAGFTNELGVDGTVRFLRNVMGMWVQSQCLEQWRREGADVPGWDVLDPLTAQVAPRQHLMDIGDDAFFAPGDMPARVDAACEAAGFPAPQSIAEYMRCIDDSLALAYRRALAQAREVTGITPSALHIVGGGSKNAILCQAAADATGLPVVAGPTECTALGNMGVQLQALGAIPPGLAALRTLVANNQPTTTYTPNETEVAAWDAVDHKLM
ncbi:MAG: rhamnulokinase family protein [Actinomycetaceae bacterium]|nr:rhamnulokinase family protein [Actinomycetaceae bacterium]MDU0969927.1 rhamnulokinase family protein [Actinomycetaceae bacterium]